MKIIDKSLHIEIDPKILSRVSKTILQYELIQDKDRIAVAVSGGKDSFLLLMILNHLKKYAPVHFDLHAVHLDQVQPGYNYESLYKQLEYMGVPYTIVRRDTYQIVLEKLKPGQSTCFMCSRLRRGHLYSFCQDKGYNKLALGHHLEDGLETFLMNILTKGKLRSMEPKLIPENPENPVVIRPLAFLEEQKIIDQVQKFPVEMVHCPVCSEQEDLLRPKMRQLLEDMKIKFPDVKNSMRGAIERGLFLQISNDEN